MRGLFIVFEGLNGAGKSACIDKLLKLFPDQTKVKVYKFPDRTGHKGDIINKFLKKEIELGSYDKLSLFSQNRRFYLDEMIKLINKGVTIICDRYIYSAIMYQLSNKIKLSKKYVSSIIQLVAKFDKGLIKPDIVFLIEGQYLHLRNEPYQRYHYADNRNGILFNNYKNVLNMSDVKYYIILNAMNELNKVSATIKHILDIDYKKLVKKPIQYF